MTAALSRRAALTGTVASVAMVGAAIVVAAPVAGVDRTVWNAALGKYRQARATSDSCPPDHPSEDALVDAYCLVMDQLIIDTPAPDWAAVLTKMDLIAERMEGMVYDNDYPDAIRADVTRLARVEVAA